MAAPNRSELTQVLRQLGEDQAVTRSLTDRLFELVYNDLHRIAADAMRGERFDHTLWGRIDQAGHGESWFARRFGGQHGQTTDDPCHGSMASSDHPSSYTSSSKRRGRTNADSDRHPGPSDHRI